MKKTLIPLILIVFGLIERFGTKRKLVYAMILHFLLTISVLGYKASTSLQAAYILRNALYQTNAVYAASSRSIYSIIFSPIHSIYFFIFLDVLLIAVLLFIRKKLRRTN